MSVRVLVIYFYITNHSKTQWLKTISISRLTSQQIGRVFFPEPPPADHGPWLDLLMCCGQLESWLETSWSRVASPEMALFCSIWSLILQKASLDSFTWWLWLESQEWNWKLQRLLKPRLRACTTSLLPHAHWPNQVIRPAQIQWTEQNASHWEEVRSTVANFAIRHSKNEQSGHSLAL